MRRRARRAFWAAFSVSAVVFSLLYGGALGQLRRAAAQPPAAWSTADPQDAITLLLAHEGAREPQTFCLLRFDPARKQVACALLPGSLGLGESTLAQVWRLRGAPAAASALAQSLGAAVDRTLSLSDEPLVSLLDCVGSIDLTLEAPVGSLPAGRQIFDGSRLLLLARESAAALPEGERRALLERAGEELLRQRLPFLRGRDLEKLYLTAVNAGRNDLTALDYETRRTALAALLEDASGVFVPVSAEGDALTGASREAIRQAFSDAPPVGNAA